jgi:hypothetical protein
VTTLALSCSVLNENSPIKTHQLLYWSGEKNLYQCDTFHNEIRPRENNLFVIPSSQTKKIIRMLDKTTYKDLDMFCKAITYKTTTKCLADNRHLTKLIRLELQSRKFLWKSNLNKIMDGPEQIFISCLVQPLFLNIAAVFVQVS